MTTLPPQTIDVPPAVLHGAVGLLLALYVLAQTLIIVYSSHRYLVLVRWWRARRAPRAPAPEPPESWPIVTVQLPLFNEPEVACRLVEAVARLDYPRDRLEIQVLDDSTDETTAIAGEAVERHRRMGLDIRLIHRARRCGFKAGALAEGLRRSRGEFVAVFDADFVPPRDFLRRTLPRFSNSDVGMVQARWGHLNRERSLLTAAQAVMLDAHFLLEHETRMGAGLFFNFNGTAGVWRRACIESAGGWSADTLTEDLDLSYRAQLAGWRFVFDPSVVCPAELPGDIEALKSQQRRWTKGSIQVACKILPRVFTSPVPRAVKFETLFHLTSNLTYPLLLLLAVLMLPVMLAVPNTGSWLGAALQVGVVAFGVLPVCLFLVVGQVAAGREAPSRILRGVASALALGIGLSVNNSRAALEGFGRARGQWERTPKTGDTMAGIAARRVRHVRGGWTEAILAAYFVGLAGFAALSGHARALPFIALLIAGFLYVGWVSRRPSAWGAGTASVR